MNRPIHIHPDRRWKTSDLLIAALTLLSAIALVMGVGEDPVIPDNVRPGDEVRNGEVISDEETREGPRSYEECADLASEGSEEYRAHRLYECWQEFPISEDDPRWDCHTMGNLICGPGRGDSAPVEEGVCFEDQLCWDCHTMGNRICGEVRS